MNGKRKTDMRPTWTSLTIQALGHADDFQTRQQLMEATGGTSDQISAALSHLKKFHAVDCLESDGYLYWFLTGEDDRERIMEERTPEQKGNRTRRTGYKRSPLRVVRNDEEGGT